MDWNSRYGAMKKALNLTNKKVAEITGNTPNSIGVMTQPKAEFPRWAKLAVVVFEKMSK